MCQFGEVPGDRRLRERHEGEKSSYAASLGEAHKCQDAYVGEIWDRRLGGTTAVEEPNPPGERSETREPERKKTVLRRNLCDVRAGGPPSVFSLADVRDASGAES